MSTHTALPNCPRGQVLAGEYHHLDGTLGNVGAVLRLAYVYGYTPHAITSWLHTAGVPAPWCETHQRCII